MEKRLTALLLTSLLAFVPALAEDESNAENAVEETPAEPEPEKNRGDGISSPKTMSGMSILGNEEAPKSLVIVPWKSSEMGDAITLSDTLDDRATPVDKEVFLRQLRYYEIRNSE